MRLLVDVGPPVNALLCAQPWMASLSKSALQFESGAVTQLSGRVQKRWFAFFELAKHNAGSSVSRILLFWLVNSNNANQRFRTLLSGLVSACVLIGALYGVGPIFSFIPRAVLAAIIIVNQSSIFGQGSDPGDVPGEGGETIVSQEDMTLTRMEKSKAVMFLCPCRKEATR